MLARAMALTLAVILTFLSTLGAQVVGERSPTGYIYQGNGIWQWPGGGQYTRTLRTVQGYYANGCYYPGYQQYAYYPYTAPYVPPVQQVITPQTPDWRSKMLDVAAANEKYAYNLQKGYLEQQYFLEGAKALGLGNRPAYPGASYALSPGGGGYGSYISQGNFYHTIAPVNASTSYGVSYTQLASVYNDSNLTTLYQQASQLAAGAQRLSEGATGNFQALVGQEGENRRKVAEILARGEVAMRLLQVMNGPATAETKGFSFKVSPGGKIDKIDEGVTPEAKAKLLEDWTKLAIDKCAACHNGGTIKGGFDVAAYPKLSPDAKQKVWARLTTDDEKIRMPRKLMDGPGGVKVPDPSGAVGPKLTNDELRLFFVN